MGFKSLLRLGGRIDLFTKASRAIRFDPQRCREELNERFGVLEALALRLAWPLEESERSDDCILTQLSWAETIVRVEVRVLEILEHVRREIGAFPAEFLLFFPVSAILALDDGAKPSRELRVAVTGNDYLLHDGSDQSRWRVATRNVAVTEERAIGDATPIHARNSVPLAWAVPLEGKQEEAGNFWAFFPTNTPTYLPGIVNAPWKLTSDRKAIIGGEWNTALMHEAACLITETLESLSTPGDPARPLDAFPRKLDRGDEDAEPLVEAIWTALTTAAVIPDATATLRPARELWRHPRDKAELARQWQELACPDDLVRTVHASCLHRQRSSRLNVLAERLKAQGSEQSQRQVFAGTSPVHGSLPLLPRKCRELSKCSNWPRLSRTIASKQSGVRFVRSSQSSRRTKGNW